MKEIFNKTVLVLLILTTTVVHSQKNADDNIILSPDPIENITLHTDRDIYLNGEKIWFKAYCLKNDQTIENVLSKVLYVELFNYSRNFIIRQKFKITDGISQGTLEIPKDFLSGNYYLRAYTQLLKNYPPETYFTTLVSIINPSSPIQLFSKEMSPDQIEIIPEYGFLINGINNKVAFRVQGYLSQETKSIIIIDDKNNILGFPKVEKEGLGIFEFNPEKSKSYFLKLILRNNDSIVKKLPLALSEGIAIKILPTVDDQLNINIIHKKDIRTDQSKKDFTLSINSQNNQVVLQEQITLENEITPFSFPKNEIPPGLNYLSVKDLSGNILLNYAFWHKNLREIPIIFDQQKQSYLQRELVKLTIDPKNTVLKGISNLSVSVVKKKTYNNLPPYIFDDPQLLQSYCRNIDSESLDDDQENILSILYNKFILCQSRPDIKPVLCKWLPEIRNVSLSGIIYDKRTMLPKADIPIYVSIFKNNPQVHINRTQQNGEFVFSLNDVENLQDIFLCPIADSGNKLEIKINADFSNLFPDTKDIPLRINDSDASFLKELYINQQTNNLYKTPTSSKQKPLYQYPINIKQPEISVLLSDFVNMNSLETVFREIIPNCLVRKKKDQYLIYVVDGIKSFNSEYPLILVDNIPVFNVNELFNIHPSKIKKIEVSPTSLVLGDNIIYGLILITTNTDNFGGIKMPEGSKFLEYQTIAPTYLFEAPVYDSEEKKSDRSADFRTLLYWNPNLNTSGNTSISFYTSDHCSEYDIIVRGITNDGQKVFGKTSFSVIKEQ